MYVLNTDVILSVAIVNISFRIHAKYLNSKHQTAFLALWHTRFGGWHLSAIDAIASIDAGCS